MSEFPLPPEPPPPGDGTSPLKDPVLTVRQLTGFTYLARRPSLHSDHALVFFTARGTTTSSCLHGVPGAAMSSANAT